MSHDEGQKKPLSKARARLRLVGILAGNLIVWLAVPYFLGIYVATIIPSDPLSDLAFVVAFGLTISGFAVASAATEGRFATSLFDSGANLAVSAYLWLSLGGGNLSFSVGKTSVDLGFTLLALLFILPSLWSAVRSPVSFVLTRRAQSGQSVAPP